LPNVASLRQLIDRLARPPEEIRAENLREWATSVPDATPIERLEPRKRARVAGVIQNVRIDPREGHGSIEATIIDGTGQLVVKWLGRPTKTGIRLGNGLIVDGTVGSQNGELVVLNPEYQLVVGPEHG
jgi:RecG-like helicase